MTKALGHLSPKERLRELSNKGGQRPAPKANMLLTKLECKNEADKRCKRDHAAQEECEDTVSVCRKVTRKPRAIWN